VVIHRRVTVRCPRCERNVTVNAAAGDCSEHWCARCCSRFTVTLDDRGRVQAVEVA